MDAPETLTADPKPQPAITDPQMDTNHIYEQEHERPQQVSDDQPIQLAQNDVPQIRPTADTHHIVQAPDGAKVAFPKGTPPDTMHTEMTKWWQPRVQQAQAAWDSVRHAANQAARAIGLPADQPEWQLAVDDFMRDPIDKTTNVVGAVIGGLAHGANSVIPSTPENTALAERAQHEYEQGNTLAAATTLVPLIGDNLAKAVKQAQSKDFSGSIGTTLGTVAPFLTESFKGEGELPITREKAVPPTTTSYEHTPAQNGQFGNYEHVVTTKNAEGHTVGHLAAQDTAPGEVTIRSNQIYDEAHRGVGKGTAAIRTLVDETSKNPDLKVIHSDITTTGAARGAWEKIAEANPDTVTKETFNGVPRWSVDLDKVREKASNAPEFNGEERRGNVRGPLMSPTQIENNLKTGQPVSTPFDATQGAMDTINRDLASRLEKPKATPTPEEDTTFWNKKEAEAKAAAEPQFTGNGSFRQAAVRNLDKGQYDPSSGFTGKQGLQKALSPEDLRTLRLGGELKNTVGTPEGAARDTEMFQQAKDKLGPDATFSEIAREAQSMKESGSKGEPLQVRHWSKQREPLTETNPEKFGTGRAGAERSRASEPGFLPRTYFGMEGYKEPAVQSGAEHSATLDSSKYYNVIDDPKGIWKKGYAEGGATGAERAVKDAGYHGYYNPEQQVAASFEKVPVEAKKNIASMGADSFNAENGRPPVEKKEVGVSPRAKEIADEYDKLKHNPNDPAVQRSYDAMTNDIDAQWDYATKKMGVKFEPWDEKGQPYANSKEMVKDVTKNKHLYFFRGVDMPTDHPLAAVDPQTGLTYNEKMRAVHDLFGHAASGNQFGPVGEERAWQEHRQMFSPEAVPAVTTETRGQNSWTNFGAHLRDAEGNIPGKGEKGAIPAAERPYAENKAALLPDWTHQPEGAAIPDAVAKLHNEGGGSTYNPTQGDMNGRPAYAVPAHPELSKVFAGEKTTPEAIRAYMNDPKVAAALKADPRLSIGTWANEGKTYLDLSTTVANRDEAIALGKANNQIAIRDLAKGEDINTGGTGTPTINTDAPKLSDLWHDETGTYTSGAFMRYLAKNKLMSPAGKDVLDAAAKDKIVPGWAEVSQFLTPEDRAQASLSVQKNVVDLVNKFNPEWVSDAAKAGSAAKGWYSRATGLIQHMFGDEAHRFTNFVASLSPQKDVEQNFTDALNFYNMWQDAGKPLGPDNEKVIRDLTERAEVGMSGQVARNQLYENLVNEVQPTGPKVSNFARNLKGNMDAVTKDRWMAYLFGNNERMFRWFKEGTPKPAVHLAADALIRAVGQSIGMLPAEVQETSWSFLRTVVNLTEKEKISPKEAIGRVNDTLIKEGASELTRLIADSPKVQSALNRLATATGDERFRADTLQNSPRFKQLLQEHAEQPSTGGGAGSINRANAERGVKQAIKARSSLSEARKAKEAAAPAEKPAPKKAPKDKDTEFNPSDMSSNVRPTLSEKMKNALA